MIDQPKFYSLVGAIEREIVNMFQESQESEDLVNHFYEVGYKKMLCYLYLRFPLSSQIPHIISDFEKICDIRKVENREELIHSYREGEWAAINWYVDMQYDIESRPI